MKTILIVDDDIDIGNLLEEALRRAGYGTLRAYSGTEALLVLEKQRPDLILLDLMLPGLAGEDALPRMRGIPVIVLSARAGTITLPSPLISGRYWPGWRRGCGPRRRCGTNACAGTLPSTRKPVPLPRPAVRRT